MNTRTARRIRAGLMRAGFVDCFRGFPTHPQLRALHRGKLTRIGQRAFDRAQARTERRALDVFIEELRVSIEFAGIVNRNFQEMA